MKRLTKCSPLTENEAMALSLTDLYMRLKAYEDTGLEPEDAEHAKSIPLRLYLTKYRRIYEDEKINNIINIDLIETLINEAKAVLVNCIINKELEEGYGGHKQ